MAALLLVFAGKPQRLCVDGQDRASKDLHEHCFLVVDGHRLVIDVSYRRVRCFLKLGRITTHFVASDTFCGEGALLLVCVAHLPRVCVD